MPQVFWRKVKEPWAGFSRRDLFQRGGLLAAAQALGGSVRQARGGAPGTWRGHVPLDRRAPPDQRARARSPSSPARRPCPKSSSAMDEASRSFVHMDELMDGVGKRLAELTRRGVGHRHRRLLRRASRISPPAAIAGGNPERMQRLPNLTGLKSEVDHAGLLAQCLRSRHAHAGREARDGARQGRAGSRVQRAHRHGLHPRRPGRRRSARARESLPKSPGARTCRCWWMPRPRFSRISPTCTCSAAPHAVAYSGGKCIRGPQAAGLLLGEKTCCRAPGSTARRTMPSDAP